MLLIDDPSRLTEPMRWLMDSQNVWNIECAGFGLNLVSGNFESACLIVVDDEDFWSSYGGQIEANRVGDTALSADWYKGNAAEDGRETRGWLLGHFIDPVKGVRSSKAVEVKWSILPAGEKRSEWTADAQRTTLVLMVQGNVRVDLTEASVTLTRQGDYVVWGPGIGHTWEAISDSVVITVRWPSAA